MTKIEWAKNKDGSQGRTWNPVTGCSKISAGCLLDGRTWDEMPEVRA